MLGTLKMTLIASALSAVVAFGLGYQVSLWRSNSKQLKEERKEKIEYAKQVDELAIHLDNTVKAANDVALKTQKSLDDIDAVVTAKNTSLAALSKRTREIQNEISKLVAANCPVPVEYQRVQTTISETANSNRDKLYPNKR